MNLNVYSLVGTTPVLVAQGPGRFVLQCPNIDTGSGCVIGSLTLTRDTGIALIPAVGSGGFSTPVYLKLNSGEQLYAVPYDIPSSIRVLKL